VNSKRRRKRLQKSVNHINKAIDRILEYDEATGINLEVVVRDLLDARKHIIFQATVIEQVDLAEDRRA